MKALVIHGPNLNLLGSRDVSVYGCATLDEVNDGIRQAANELGIEVAIYQTQREDEIIELLHAGAGRVGGALVNPGAYSHTSRAIADAIRSIDYPVIEVHQSNIHAREEWRRISITAEAAKGVVAGFGATSWIVALHAIEKELRQRESRSR